MEAIFSHVCKNTEMYKHPGSGNNCIDKTRQWGDNFRNIDARILSIKI